MPYVIPDLDIDCNNKTLEKLTSVLQLIPASQISETTIKQHPVGYYPENIPTDPITGLSAIDYKSAENDLGFIKFDFLHNTVYDKFSSRKEIEENLSQPIDWDKLKDEEFVKTLPHINNYYQLLQKMPVHSIEELAMFIAIIRPGKKYLQEKAIKLGWNYVIDEIWTRTDEYMFKKSHAIAYALLISLLLK